MELMFSLLAQGVQMLLVVAIAPLQVGLTRKIKARLLLRRGASIIQPYRDLWKLLRKEALMAENASWLCRMLPYVVFSTTWVAAALVPTYATGLIFGWSADIIVVVSLLGTARFALVLAGLDVGTSFGGIGSSREMLIASLAEPAMLLVVFTSALVAGTTQLSEIALHLLHQPIGLRVSLGLALVAMVIVALAENARIPVDNPATHLELTMVHEAMILEYSGRHLALMELAACVKMVLYVSLIACLFFPVGLADPGSRLPAMAAGMGIYAVKLTVAAFLLAVGETTAAKMRVFRVPQFLAIAGVFATLAVILLFVSRGM